MNGGGQAAPHNNRKEKHHGRKNGRRDSIRGGTAGFGHNKEGGDYAQGKDGNSYRQILVPNVDRNDHRPWQTFVVKSNHVHDNKFGKGMWCKLSAEGHTTLRRNVRAGEDEQGKPIWKMERTKVSNRELKQMVEAYKDRSSMKEKLAEKKAEAAQQRPAQKTAEKAKEASL